MIIYLDIVFFENLIMNYIILYATNYILKKKVKIIKIVIASTIGAIYSIIVYLNILEIYSGVIMKIILSVVMVYIGTQAKTIYRELLIFYLVSFVFGGAAFSLVYFIKPQNIININESFIGNYPIKIGILGAILGLFVMTLVFKFVKSKITRKDMIYILGIIIEQKQIEVKAMLDTGNMLREPITGNPVILVEKEVLYNLIDSEILKNVEKIIGGDMEIKNKNLLSRFKAIPYTSIGKQNGILLGFRVDKIVLKGEYSNEEIKDVVVAIYNKSFTKNNKYNALIGMDVIERSERNEYIANFKG
ncbi:MAG: sigma-E processing peptidase SpoIIGA [Clostridia bacterium]|nr:sigma-E processing peptidase SpoIIGA [Clostridia bacterium]